MKYRRLGRNGPQVSAVSMGRGAAPVKSDTPQEADFNAAIHRALDLGVNFFDSSDAYWGARHEVMLSRALVNLWYGSRRKLDSVSIGQVWKPTESKA